MAAHGHDRPAHGRPRPADSWALWTDATAPKDVAQLAVHKKKVDEVKAWLVQFACPGGAASQAGALPGNSFRHGSSFGSESDEQLVKPGTQGDSRGRGKGSRGRFQPQGRSQSQSQNGVTGNQPAFPGASKVLVLRGPPGCGKSTVVKVLASSLGLAVHEWSTPVPTLWAEHKQLQGAPGEAFLGTGYASKLDSFVTFLQSNTKFAPLQLPLASTSATSPLSDAKHLLEVPTRGFVSRLDTGSYSAQGPASTQPVTTAEALAAAATGSEVSYSKVGEAKQRASTTPSLPVPSRQRARQATATQVTGASQRSQVADPKSQEPTEGAAWGSLAFLSQLAEGTGPRKRGDVAAELADLRASGGAAKGETTTAQPNESLKEERVYVSDSEGSEDLPSQLPSQNQSQQPSQSLTHSRNCSQNQSQSQCSSQGLNLSQEWGKKGPGTACAKKETRSSSDRGKKGEGGARARKAARGKGKRDARQATLEFHARPVRSTRNTAKVVINLGDDVDVEEEEDGLVLQRGRKEKGSGEEGRGAEGKQKGRMAGDERRKVKGGRRKKGRRIDEEEEVEQEEEEQEHEEEEEVTGIEDDLEEDDDDDDDFPSFPKRGSHRRSKPAAPAAPAGSVTASKGNGTLGSFWSRPRKAPSSVAKAEASALEDSTLTESSLPLSTTALGLPRLSGRGSSTVSSTVMEPVEVVGPPLLLLDDFPFAGSRANLGRLCSALHTLASSSAVPAVIILSDATTGIGGGGAGNDSSSSAWDDTVKKALLAALQDGGAHVISFNPLTPKMILKTLTAITASQRGLPPGTAAAASSSLEAIAEQSGGDLRRAICQVQLLLTGYKGSNSRGPSTGGGSTAHAQQGWTWDPGGEEDAEWEVGTKRKGKGQSKRGQKGVAEKRGARQAGAAKRGRSTGEGSGVPGDDCVPAGEGPGEGGALEMAFPRDHSLTLFHAIGKFLYNKRKQDQGQGQDSVDPSRHPTGSQVSNSEPHFPSATDSCDDRTRSSASSFSASHSATAAPCTVTAGRGAGPGDTLSCRALDEALDPSLRRPPLGMRPAEDILGQSQIEASTLCSFLHENYLDFLDQDGGLGDAASASSYMSDAAVLMAAPGTGRNNFSTTSWAAGEDEACTTGLSASAAASVAARGVLFSNCHPAPHRFQAIRAPAASSVEKRRREKQADIIRMIEASALVTGSFPVTFSSFALDLYPHQEQQLQEEGEALAGTRDAEAGAQNGAEEEEIESD